MKGATSKQLITPMTIGDLCDLANTIESFMDIECYYSPEFTSTLLAVLKSTKHQK